MIFYSFMDYETKTNKENYRQNQHCGCSSSASAQHIKSDTYSETFSEKVRSYSSWTKAGRSDARKIVIWQNFSHPFYQDSKSNGGISTKRNLMGTESSGGSFWQNDDSCKTSALNKRKVISEKNQFRADFLSLALELQPQCGLCL